MTIPNQILANATHLVTRRCTQRKLLLVPSPEVNQVFEYCLALAAQETGVLIHSYMALSNHWHGVVTDPNRLLPVFMERMNGLAARCMNRLRGLTENFWSTRKYGDVMLEAKEDFLAKMTYVLANPVAAGLVCSASQWPGASSYGMTFGEAKTIEKPKFYFKENGATPDTVELKLSVPPGFTADSPERFSQRLDKALVRCQEKIRRDFAKAGRSFLGRQAVLDQEVGASPETGEERCRLNPRIAAKDSSRVARALERLRRFKRCYRLAYKRWRQGDLDAKFPAGTYWLRKFVGVKCEPDSSLPVPIPP